MDIKHFPYFQVISNEHSTANDLIGEHHFPIGTIVEVTNLTENGSSYNCAPFEDDSLDNWSVHPKDLKQLSIRKDPNGFVINWHEEGGFLAKVALDSEMTYELFEYPRYGGDGQFVGFFTSLSAVLAECEKRT
jgi:hypothetical protein